MSTGCSAGDIRMLLVGDACPVLHRAARMAQDAGAEVSIAPTPADALATLRGESVALVMIDVMADVPAFMAQLRRERFTVPVMACGVDAPADRAVAAIRAGARDYVPLPPEPALIAAALAAAAAPRAVDPIGTDPAVVAALDYARGLAQGRIAILLSGERGTGKELIARTIHAASRRPGRMLTLECAGVARDIVESELFGHDAHAASGIAGPRAGKIAQAAGGTLFVADIDRLAPETQARLVAGLAADPRGAAPRLVAATGVDLARCVSEGTFRADLLARIAGARIALPPLRRRPGDLPALAAHFATRAARAEGLPDRPLCPTALRSLAGYDWPGNVRELEDVIARAVVIAAGAMIGAGDLVLIDGTPLAGRAAPPPARVDALVGRTVEEVERALILRTLETCRGNRTSASGILGISVRTMRNKLKTFVEAGIAVAPAA